MELKNHGWTLDEISNLTIPDINDALQWVENNKAKESQRLLAGFQYHLLAQHKKTLMEARKLYKKVTQTKPINPKNRPTLIDTIKQWANMSGFKS